MAEETKAVEQPHSCKIAINAKGMYSGEVKVYAETAQRARITAAVEADILEQLIKNKNSPPKPGAV